MECNNKHILKESDESEKFVGELVSYEEDKIKGDSHKNIASSR